MPSRRQIRASKKREENRKQSERDHQKLKDEAARLRTMESGLLGVTYGTLTGRFSMKTSHISERPSIVQPAPYIRETPNYPSVIDFTAAERRFAKRLTKEMQAREDAAQEEIARKRKRVAVIAHKSAYQYITDETDLTLMGRK